MNTSFTTILRVAAFVVAAPVLTYQARATIAFSDSPDVGVETRWVQADSPNTLVHTLDLLVLTTGGQHGSVSGAGQYQPGSEVEVLATPDPGYLFVEWSGDASGSANPLALHMNTNKTVTAVFSEDLRDPDADDLTNHQEIVVHQTDPAKWDTDDDGFGDGYEVQSGFSPTSGASSPDTRLATYTAVEVEFGAGLGKTYRVESSTDLQHWTTVESGIPGTGGTVTRFYSIRAIPKRYFRAVKE